MKDNLQTVDGLKKNESFSIEIPFLNLAHLLSGNDLGNLKIFSLSLLTLHALTSIYKQLNHFFKANLLLK